MIEKKLFITTYPISKFTHVSQFHLYGYFIPIEGIFVNLLHDIARKHEKRARKRDIEIDRYRE